MAREDRDRNAVSRSRRPSSGRPSGKGDCHKRPEHSRGGAATVESRSKPLSAFRKRAKVFTDLAKFPEENPNPVLRILANGCIIYANPAAWPIMSGWGVVVGDEVPLQIAEIAGESLMTGLPRVLELEVKGHLYEIQFVPIQPESYINVYGRNLTECRRIEQALRKLQREQQAILDNISDMVWLKDAQSRYILVNEAFANACGCSVAEIAGKQDDDLWPADLATKYRADDSEIMRLGQRKQIDETMEVKGTGQRRVIETIKTPVRDAQGLITGTAGIARDVTERRALQAQNAQMQKMDAIGRLAAGVAHEINTPMQYVSDNIRFVADSFTGLCHLLGTLRRHVTALEKRPLADPRLQELDEILRQMDLEYLLKEIPPALEQSMEGVRRISKIIRAMRDFSHPGMEAKVPSDVNKIIDSALTIAGGELRNVAEVELHLGPALPPVSCDPGELNQALLNIIVNAAQAIKETGRKGRIRVSTCVEGTWVQVRISDTGTGISEEAQPRIFEPFFTTKEPGKGTGQGLAIAHNVIVKKHGGAIAFQTSAGQGTTFIVRLPAISSGEGK